MRIINWNVERLKHNKNAILKTINFYDADIVVLTETSSALYLGQDYFLVATDSLDENQNGVKYKIGENRVSIWSKYRIISSLKTCDKFNSVCAELKTDLGDLIIYGTVIGVFGGKGDGFKKDLKNQTSDFKKFDLEKNYCIVGDFNVFFSGYNYPSKIARTELNEVFTLLQLKNLTGSISENVDHVVISNEFLKDKMTTIEIFNSDKKLSDHIGICLTIQ